MGPMSDQHEVRTESTVNSVLLRFLLLLRLTIRGAVLSGMVIRLLQSHGSWKFGQCIGGMKGAGCFINLSRVVVWQCNNSLAHWLTAALFRYMLCS